MIVDKLIFCRDVAMDFKDIKKILILLTTTKIFILLESTKLLKENIDCDNFFSFFDV